MPVVWNPPRWWDCCTSQDEKKGHRTVFGG